MLGVESVTADSVVVKVEAKTMPGKAPVVTRGLRQRLKTAFDLAGIKLKEEATPSTPAAAAVDALPPSALSDPASARSLATKPIPLPVQHPGDDPLNPLRTP